MKNDNISNSLASVKALSVVLFLAGFTPCGFAGDSLPIREVQSEATINFDSGPISVGSANNVFVGRVIGNLGLATNIWGTTNVDSGRLLGVYETPPSTLFEVEVLRNIKGELPERVVVRINGGIKDGIYYRHHSPDPMEPDGLGMLVVGASYAFQSLGVNPNDLLVRPHPNLRSVISKIRELRNEEVLHLAKAKIADLLEAYANEKPWLLTLTNSFERARTNLSAADFERFSQMVAHEATHYANNNFKSLPAEKQQQTQSEYARLKAELAAETSAKAAVK